jgi:hypothetical protein
MQRSGLVLDVFTYDAAGAVMQSDLMPGVVTCSVALWAGDKGAQWRQARGLLAMRLQSSLGLDIVAYSAARSACEKGTQRLQALGLLAVLLQSGIVPKLIAYITAVRACTKRTLASSNVAVSSGGWAEGGNCMRSRLHCQWSLQLQCWGIDYGHLRSQAM